MAFPIGFEPTYICLEDRCVSTTLREHKIRGSERCPDMRAEGYDASK